MIQSSQMSGYSAEVAYYLETRDIEPPKPWQAPLVRTPEPCNAPGAVFDPERVDHAIAVFRCLTHTQGRLAGQPLMPDPWQIAYIIAPVFGWVRENDDGDYVRIIRELWVEVPRKNGKTTLAGGMAILLTCGDNEPGAQVIAAATTRDQAGFCFRPIAQLAQASPVLKKHVKLYRSAQKIVHESSGSYFQAISNVADAQHGANIHGAIIDEIHVHKDAGLIEAIETGTGSRTQPLIVEITTADDGRPDTIYSRKRRRIEQLANETITDFSVYGVIWAAALSEREMPDPFSEETWKRANPGYGISPTKDYLAGKAAKAKDTPAEFSEFLRLHLGIRTKQKTRWVSISDWDATAGPETPEEDLEGQEAFGGLDLASVSDITALCWTFPDYDNEDTYRAVWRFWLPEAAFRAFNQRTAGEADVWVRDGWITLTSGEVIDNSAIIDQISRDAEKFRVKSVAYDRWGATDVVRHLDDGGIDCIAFGQGFASMSGPMKEWQRLIVAGRYKHGSNPVMRWMFDNLSVQTDPAGNIKPDKGTANDKIDGCVAAIMALSEAIVEGQANLVDNIW